MKHNQNTFDYSELFAFLFYGQYDCNFDWKAVIGLSLDSLLHRLCGKVLFTTEEVFHIINALAIPTSDINKLFFTPKANRKNHRIALNPTAVQSK